MSAAPPSLFLFDIDGTLLTTGGSGYRSFLRSCSEVLGIDGPIDGIHMAGKLDRGIYQEIIDLYRPGTSRTESETTWELFRRRYIDLLKIESRDTSEWGLFPGVRRIVDYADRCGKLALLTGNVREGALIKIGAFGLERYFPTGGFGELDITRSELAGQAFERACEHFDTSFQPDQTYVLGDTVNDIRAARAIGAHAIAVATGTVSSEELAAAEPEVLVDDFASGAERVIEYISC
ncbi:MAG: HAD family hydrolase [Candidatus Glassbacteria bacterium]|nr:HAD family hydrolase [Candidatus Glassbacteria bacterium]